MDVAVLPDGTRLYVSDKTAGRVVVMATADSKVVGEVAVEGQPTGLAVSPDGRLLYVAQRTAHLVAVIDTEKLAVIRRIAVGPWPVAVAVSPDGRQLLSCNRGDHTVSVIDLINSTDATEPVGGPRSVVAGSRVEASDATERVPPASDHFFNPKELKRITVVRDPAAVAIVPDGSMAVVTNLLPNGRGTDPMLGATVSVIDLAKLQQTSMIDLPPGSTMAAGVCTSPDGHWAYVVHALARFKMPVTQLERGWVHTYALSILDLNSSARLATVLLDDLTAGAADPWSVCCSPDGSRLWISHGGVHEVSIVDIRLVHELLDGRVPPWLAQLRDGMRENIWVRISNNRALQAKLENDLTALTMAKAIRRVPSGGNGPRGLALSPDGKRLFVANYYSGTIGVLDAEVGKLLDSWSVGTQPTPDAARRGETYFHDATTCFQRWHSCASCHPDDARVDGLTWDFMRDGIGNGNDVISLVLSHKTPPHNRRATRPDPRECMRTGVLGSHFYVPKPSDVDDLLAYVESVRPEPNPNLPKLAEAAARGKILFEGKAHCSGCHPAPLFTDLKMHDVGTPTPGEPDARFDTPSLVEAYRTAPYFHDGRARTLKETLTKHNPSDRHGHTSGLSRQEVEDLVAYVLSL
ncbi:MAG: beta-propeller fold lactonase family protein [Pirellulales bacterium]|nr:beta-propeller fold lactonase family protein [Pirellulales bacterium]